MIRFLLTRGYGHTLKKVRKSRERPTLGVVHYEDIFRARSLRPGTYVFTDLDRLSPRDLERASRLYLLLKDAGFPVLNNPAVVKQRYPLLRALHAASLNDFNAHRARELPAEMRFPVFLRKEHGHGAPLSDLMHTRGEVLGAVDRAVTSGVPLDDLIVIEYAGEPVREGQYRKLAAFCFRGEIVPHFSVNDRQWLVKDGYLDPSIEDLYLEERRILETNPYAEHLQKVFEIACIDYGRVDFSFYKGRIQVFEINTNPNVPAYTRHPSATRLENMRISWEKYLAALRTLDSPSGKPVSFPLHEPDHADNVLTAREARARRIRAAQKERDTRLGTAEISRRIKYAPGTIIDFSDRGASQLHTREGWGSPEPWGTWTRGRKAILEIHLQKAPSRDLQLTVLARALVHESHPVQRAEVRVNGEKLAVWEISKGGFVKLRLKIPAALLRAKECEIAFTITDPCSPKSLGLSDDGRLLGLGIASMKLR